ncbi:N-acetyltransferase [Mucilaginibacter hurinus]|uniref:N-acetyltransferase n=1 Tax=Mucilaginibacter hurinus TaxID=2201324 RepID=A0A367GQ17_9SPHI|nr:GNAT family N-acetyltransferase [Mucilaginibacter hurinus]RCH55552.1 N-acetyltransferase [Mucilaginibacter hurinus]
MDLTIQDLNAESLTIYKAFLREGLINDADNFRISANDDRDLPFPTNGTPDSFTLGAYTEEQLAGVVSFERDGATREKLRHKGTLFRMYVSPEHRGKGIAKKLITEVLSRARALGDIEQVNLTVIATNPNAIKLYEQFGFTIYSREENACKWDGKYLTELQMVVRF